MILRGPSMKITESQFEAIAASFGTKYAISDGQFEVEMILRGPHMTAFDDQLVVVIRSPKSM